MSSAIQRSQAIESLRRQLRGSHPTQADVSVVRTGLRSLDAILPGGGLPQGSVIEWISDAPGQSATSLALRCASVFLQKPGCLAVIDEGREFFPSTLEAHGIPLSRLLLIRANTRSVNLLHEKKTARRRFAAEDRSQSLTDRELHSQSLWRWSRRLDVVASRWCSAGWIAAAPQWFEDCSWRPKTAESP